MLTVAPTLVGGDNVASTLWWDGFTIAKNISDEDAEATFVALMNGISDDVVTANNVRTQAVWLSSAYEPTAASAGVFAATAERRHQTLPDAALHGPAAHRAGQ